MGNSKSEHQSVSAATKQKGREFVAALLDEGCDYNTIVRQVRIAVMLEALARSDNVPTRAARLTGMSGEYMRRLMTQLGIKRVAILQEEKVSGC